MLRYRAASFFANLNCPEITSGLYTKEEMLDNDFYTNKTSNKKNLNDVLKEDNEVDAVDTVAEITDIEDGEK